MRPPFDSHHRLSSALVFALLWPGCAAPKAPPLDTPIPSGSVSVPTPLARSSDGAGKVAGLGDRAGPAGSARPGGTAQASLSGRPGPGRDSGQSDRPGDKDKARPVPSGTPSKLFLASLPGYQETRITHPLAVTASGLQTGQRLYERYCDGCHGGNGAPDESNSELSRYAMADLRYPLEYRFGSSRREVFRSIAFGTSPDGETATPMPAYQETLSNSEIWELANYVGEKFQAGHY